jgi:hypothetical protein
MHPAIAPRLFLCLLAIAVLVLSCASHQASQTSPAAQKGSTDTGYDPPPDPETIRTIEGPKLELGNGFRLLSGSIVSNVCVEPVAAASGSSNAPTPDCSKERASLRIQFVENHHQLASALGLAGSVRAGLGMSSGSAAARYLRTEESSRSSIYLLVESEVSRAAEAIGPVTFSSQAHNLLTAPDPNAFLNQCGDAFVSTVRRGARIRATVAIRDVASSRSSELTVQLKARYGTIRGEAELRSALQELSNHYTLDIHILAEGVGLPKKVDTDALLQAALALDCNAGNVIEYVVEPYHIVRLPAGASLPLALPTKSRLQKLEELGKVRDDVISERAEIRRRLELPFIRVASCEPSVQALRDFDTDFTAHIESLNAAIRTCTTGSCAIPTRPERLSLPHRFPTECRPVCPGGGKTSDEGACLSCIWTGPANEITGSSGSILLKETCPLMRPGSTVKVLLKGELFNRHPRLGGCRFDDLDLGLERDKTDWPSLGGAGHEIKAVYEQPPPGQSEARLFRFDGYMTFKPHETDVSARLKVRKTERHGCGHPEPGGRVSLRERWSLTICDQDADACPGQTPAAVSP